MKAENQHKPYQRVRLTQHEAGQWDTNHRMPAHDENRGCPQEKDAKYTLSAYDEVTEKRPAISVSQKPFFPTHDEQTRKRPALQASQKRYPPSYPPLRIVAEQQALRNERGQQVRGYAPLPQLEHSKIPGNQEQHQALLQHNSQEQRSLMLQRPAFELNEEDCRLSDDEELDQGKVSTTKIKKLSGMIQVFRPADRQPEEYWPDGIKQTGAIPVVNLYGQEPFGRTNPQIPALAGIVETPQPPRAQPQWRALLNNTVVRVALGLLVGIGLLWLISKIVDIPSTVAILKARLTTPQGIGFALLSGLAFLAAFSIRGVRWKLFLNPIGKVSTLKAIQLFLVGIFLNFLLPIRGGEVAKSLMLKRISNIPISQSLPTVAMDKALDLMPALFIMALVPLLGVHMDIKLWLVLGAVGSLLICLIFFIALAAWKRDRAIALLQKLTSFLPGGLGGKIEGFATGFVDSLLAGASQPRIFLPAIALTIVAVVCDGLFAMFAFNTVGVNISFGIAMFGYTVYNMFYILPTPPGQVGSNEAIGLLIFAGLLHFQKTGVTAMFLFSHPWAALLMCGSGMMCLSALGLTVSSAMSVASGENQLPANRSR